MSWTITKTEAAHTSGTSRTLSSVVVASSGSLLIVTIHYDEASAVVSNVKFNTSETVTAILDQAGVNYQGEWIGYLLNPSVATAAVTYDVSSSGYKTGVTAQVITGNAASSPIRNSQSTNGAGTGGSTLLTMTTVSGDLVLDAVGVYGPSTPGLAPAGSQSESSGGYDFNAASGEVAGSWFAASGSSSPMGYTWTDAIPYVYAAVVIKPAGGGATVTPEIINSFRQRRI